MQQPNEDEKLNSISMHDFLDFLKLTCQVHQSITTKDDNQGDKTVLDYTELAENKLVNTLISAKANAALSPRVNDGDACGAAGSAGFSNSSPSDKRGIVID